MHTMDDIMRAAAAWVWFPRDSEQQNDELQLVRYPVRFGGGVRASQVDSTADAAAVLDHAIACTRAWGESRLTVWVSPSDSPDLEHELLRRGAELFDTVTVFASPIESIEIDIPVGRSAEVVRSIEQVREVDAINVAVWAQAPLDEEGLRIEFSDISTALAAGTGLRVLGRIDGEPVSTGGCTIVDGFTRLWGAATHEHARGRGAYRAVLAERLRASAELGARTALVKGRISTSAPILARAGFRNYGDERGYRLAV